MVCCYASALGRLPHKGNIPVKCRFVIHSFLMCCSVIFVWTAVADADNWPQWRGPNNDGICNETHLPTEWSATKNIVWKLALPGMSGATPAIWNDRLFLTSEDGDTFVIKAGPAHDVLRTNSVGEPVYASPAIANGRIYIRGEHHLFAIGHTNR